MYGAEARGLSACEDVARSRNLTPNPFPRRETKAARCASFVGRTRRDETDPRPVERKLHRFRLISTIRRPRGVVRFAHAQRALRRPEIPLRLALVAAVLRLLSIVQECLRIGERPGPGLRLTEPSFVNLRRVRRRPLAAWNVSAWRSRRRILLILDGTAASQISASSDFDLDNRARAQPIDQVARRFGLVACGERDACAYRDAAPQRLRRRRSFQPARYSLRPTPAVGGRSHPS